MGKSTVNKLILGKADKNQGTGYNGRFLPSYSKPLHPRCFWHRHSCSRIRFSVNHITQICIAPLAGGRTCLALSAYWAALYRGHRKTTNLCQRIKFQAGWDKDGERIRKNCSPS